MILRVSLILRKLRTVVNHSGKSRTGLFLVYYAVRALQVTGKEAIERVRAVRPIAFTAPGWEEFALEVLAAGGA
jgi:protein-tyrosine phosphatase